MEYTGKLYGKIGNKYFDTGVTSEDYDKLQTMNIEQTLNDVANYFKHKIIEGEFEFKKCGEHTATVLIDEKYEFQLWIANEPKNNFDFYDSSFMVKNSADFLKFRTQKERLAGWRQIKPHVQAYKNKVLKREKQKELNRLKKELEALD